MQDIMILDSSAIDREFHIKYLHSFNHSPVANITINQTII